jgi:hypothetical protein
MKAFRHLIIHSFASPHAHFLVVFPNKKAPPNKDSKPNLAVIIATRKGFAATKAWEAPNTCSARE